MRTGLSFASMIGGAVALIATAPTAAPAAREITEPSSSPFDVPADPSGAPAPFTVKVKGFQPFQNVFVEQCNGRPPTADRWQPSLDCDLGSAPAAAIADTEGVATFLATDRNHAFRPFVGESPQQLFNCLAPGGASPKNAVTDYRNCQLRVSTNNTAATDDQVFLRLRLPGRRGSGSGDSSTSSGVIVVLGALGAIALGGVAYLLGIRTRPRRRAA